MDIFFNCKIFCKFFVAFLSFFLFFIGFNGFIQDLFIKQHRFYESSFSIFPISFLHLLYSYMRYISSFSVGKVMWYFTAKKRMEHTTTKVMAAIHVCLLYTSDAADER